MFSARARHASTEANCASFVSPQMVSAFPKGKAPHYGGVLLACAIVGCLFAASTAFAQATGACCMGGLCTGPVTESQCVVDFGGWYFGDGSQCTMGGIDE